ncbi:MAG: sugar ABC transporter substrate-binding protein, partial [Mesorhizobium sp.]
MKAGAFFAGLAVIATTLLSIDAVPANAQDKKPYTIY